MSEYRVYVVGSDGHIVSALQLDCLDDNAAIESAIPFVNGRDIELWQYDRLIAKFDGKPE
jgi:hypothetical protein